MVGSSWKNCIQSCKGKWLEVVGRTVFEVAKENGWK
jgi:hypothetical protein